VQQAERVGMSCNHGNKALALHCFYYDDGLRVEEFTAFVAHSRQTRGQHGLRVEEFALGDNKKEFVQSDHEKNQQKRQKQQQHC
jgi:hypothetical protein